MRRTLLVAGPLLGGALLGATHPGCATPGDAETEAPEPPTPSADAYLAGEVEAALATAADVLLTRGYDERGDTWRGFLVQQGAAVHEVSLRSGQCNVVVATASEELRELDVRVFDADGAEVAGDDLPGHHAALRYCPSQSGTFYLVAQARTGNGLFAARRFAGPTGLVVRLDDLFPDQKPLRSEDLPRAAPELRP